MVAEIARHDGAGKAGAEKAGAEKAGAEKAGAEKVGVEKTAAWLKDLLSQPGFASKFMRCGLGERDSYKREPARK